MAPVVECAVATLSRVVARGQCVSLVHCTTTETMPSARVDLSVIISEN